LDGGAFGKFTCTDYDSIKTIHNRQGPSLFNLSWIPSLTLVKSAIPSRSHVILTLTQHRQLVADVVQSTKYLIVSTDKSLDAVLDTGIFAEFLHEWLEAS
jgi:hypothetical protein